ncbi:MAG: carboxypeptidase-like regulatory domain-containing protein, partial [Candidatus Electryonea clarkiae]|nr:carboxypeptidase-like regulatory domain-containing protein [Candidatus Electryonea clarkiae]
GMYLDVLEFHTNAVQDSTIDLSVLVKGTDYVMEGFEETTFPPFGWENPDDLWARFMSDAYEGEGYARCSWYHDYDAILTTPRLVLTAGDFIDFWWRNDNLYEAKDTDVIAGDTLWVEISDTYLNAVPTWECIAMLTADAPMDEYEEAYVAIPDTYIGNDAKLRFRHRSEMNSESRGVGLDNIIMPAPYLPVNFSVDPYYASDYVGPGNPILYTYDVTNMGIQSDKYIILVQDSSAIRYSKDIEDFETSDGGWVATADWDPVGDWAWTPTYDITNYTGANTPPPAAHSGTGLWATVPEGDYTNAGGSSYMSKTVDFSGITDAYLNFWYWSDINGTWDYCDVIVNSDILWTIDTHTPTAWEVASLDLSAYDGMSDVQILFSFYASTVVEKAGMYIDDVDYPGGSGPGPSPTGWPVTVSPPFLELAPGETGSFVATVSVPEDATIDAGQLTPILTYSREDNTVQHQVLVSALCHLKDPYEPNNVIVDATPWGYGQVTDGAQIYYNADYVDEDIDIYEFDGLAGDIIVCDFDLDPDETVFDGAIKLTDVDSTEIAFADEWAGGGSEQLKYRLLEDGTYYLVLGKWDNVLDGPYKKDSDRGENTCYYEMVLTLIPSPEVAVSPDSLQLGIVYSKETASVDLFIENTGVIGCDDLSYDIDVMIPGIETLYQSGFDDAGDWAVSGGTNWGLTNTNNAGGTPPEARFYWSPNLTALQRLISPVINTTGSTSADLTFKHYLDYYADGTLVGVQTTSDGGATWNTVWSISPTADMGPETVPVTIDNSDMGSDQFQLCWFFDGISFDINNWYVDDVKLSVGGEAWVEVSPSLGLIGQGATQTCVVTCDDTGLTDPGVYTADIIVHNNAMLDGASDVVIPLTFFYQIAAQGMIGTVTYLQTGDPLEGVMVSAGNFVTYTDADGFYQFTDIASGIYDVTFQKDGFATLVKYGIYVSPNWVSLLNVEMLFDGAVPENLIANGIPEAIELDWDKPSGGGGGGQILYELIQHDGNPVNGYYQSFGNGYGVVYDVSGYTNVTLDQLDFRHSSWGLSGIWDYSLHIVDWDTYTEVAVITGLQTTGDDQWENGIDLGSISETGLVGVFLEPLGNISTDAYPDLDADDVGPGGLSYYGALSSYADMLLSDIGDFLMDLWILADETDVPVQAQVFPAQISHNQPTRNPVTNQNITSVSTVQKVNTNTSSREADLLGYNVYEATKGFVSYLDGENNTYFIDDIVAVDVPYTYCVTAVYDEGESSPSNMATATPLASSGGYHDTFDLDWSTTGWVQDPAGGNWIWAAGYANLYWSPSAAPYDMSLISPEIDLPDDPLDVYDLTVSMYVDNYTSFDGEVWEIWLINDGGEDL